jgi:hypothetical protein
LLPTVILVLSAPIYAKPVLPHSIWNTYWGFVGTLAISIIHSAVAPILFQMFCDRFIFFRRSWILYRSVYALYDYNLIYVNATLGLYAVISRFAMLFANFVWFFPRLDRTLMPGPSGVLWAWDSGFAAYVGMLRMDHRYNNPVSMVFTELLIFRLRLFRLNHHRRQRAHPVSSESHGDPDKTQAAQPISASRVRWRVATFRALDYRRRMRNRWRLAKLLFFNPGLRLYRSHAMSDGGERRRRERRTEAVKQLREGPGAPGPSAVVRRRLVDGSQEPSPGKETASLVLVQMSEQF